MFFLRNYQKLCSSWCSSPIKHVFVVYKPLQPLSASPGRLLVDHVDEWFSLFFIIYRCVVGFSPEILGDWISTFSDRTWIEWVIWVIWSYESGTIQCQELLNLVGGLEHLFNIFQRGNHQQLMSWIATFVSWRVHVLWQSSNIRIIRCRICRTDVFFSPRDWNGQLDERDPELIIYQGSNGSESRCF